MIEKMKKYIFIALIAATISSCKSHETMQIEAIKLREDSIDKSFKNSRLDYELINRTAKMMDKFSHDFPKDTFAPYFLYKAGALNETIRNNDEALKKFNDIRVRFAETKYNGMALMAMGQLYEDVLHNKEQAKAYYKLYIDKYPNTKLASDAQKLIENMDIPVDSLIRRFERKNKHMQDSLKKLSHT